AWDCCSIVSLRYSSACRVGPPPTLIHTLSLHDALPISGRGVFVLCVTSNPEGADVQHASLEGRSVAARVAEAVAHENAEAVGLGSIGLVVGATTASATRELGIDLAAVNGPVLAPGSGAQGGDPDSLASELGPARELVPATTSRAVLWHGTDRAALREAAQSAREEITRALRG